jgi:hypothetical protein
MARENASSAAADGCEGHLGSCANTVWPNIPSARIVAGRIKIFRKHGAGANSQAPKKVGRASHVVDRATGRDRFQDR